MSAMRRYRLQRAAFCLVLAAAFLPILADTACSRELTPLLLSLSPAKSEPDNGPVCSQHGPTIGGPAQKGKRPKQVYENEHRPTPRRSYWLNDYQPQADTKVYVRRPDGSVEELPLQADNPANITFNTPFKKPSLHGAHNLYVVEKRVSDNILTIRIAKWITMHHSCGWGHDFKFDEQRTTPQSLAKIPFEIVLDDLWDGNFHSKLRSGDNLDIRVLAEGEPVENATVKITTDKKWTTELRSANHGSATVQLIRDYYPEGWSNFKRTQRGKLLITASVGKDQTGTFQGKSYSRIQYITSLPWHYTPASADYASYGYGLLVGFVTLFGSGASIYAYRERRKKPYKGISFSE